MIAALPYEFRGFRWRAEQGLPDGCRRPWEYDLRDADCTTNPLAPPPDISLVGVGHRFESFKSRPDVLEFAAFLDAPHERFPVNGDDGLQQANGRLDQQTDRLFRGRKQSLEFGEGRLSRVALEPEGLVAPHRFDAWLGRSVFDGGWQGMRGEGVPFDVDLDERQPFRVERRPGYLDRAVEVPSVLLR